MCNDAGMPRKYEQSKRLQQQEETRQRVVRAAVELHATVGPARTTVSAVAERAGVQRNTVYRHFPDERTLVNACSALFESENPFPDPATWADVPDPHLRAELALVEVYGYWESHEQLVGNVLRDAETDDQLRQISQDSWGAGVTDIRNSILAAWPATSRSPELTALLDLALSFRTWQSLVRGSGLTAQAAVGVMSRSVAAQPR